MGVPIRILHLDDNPLDAELVSLALEGEQAKLPTTIHYVRTKDEYLAALEKRDFDLILSDYRMGIYDGDQALTAAKEKCPDIPFIMVTGELGEEMVIETLRRGATDYVLKDRIFRLVPAISRALQEAESNRARKEAETRLAEAHQQISETLESIQDPFYVVSKEWRIAYVNAECEQYMGKPKSELLGRNLWEIYPLLRDSESERFLRRAMQEQVPCHTELRAILKDAWVEIRTFPKADGGMSILYRDITQRKIVEQALHLSEERFSAAFKGSPYPQLISRLEDGVFLDVNDALLSFYGMTRDEVIGHSSFELGIIANPQEREQMVWHLSNDGILRDFPMHINTRAHGARMVLVSASLLRSTEEHGVLMVLRDITKEHQVHEEVARSHRLVSEVLESIQDAFYAMDKELRITYVNRHAEEILHRRRADLLGKNIWEAFPEAVGGESYRNFLRVQKERVSFHYETESPVLKTWIESHVYPTIGGGISVFFRDITARKKMEFALKESEERFRIMANSIPQLAWMADDNGRIVWYNQRWYDYTGTTPPEMEGWGWQKVHHPEHTERVAEKIRQAFAQGNPWEDTFPLRSKTGEYRWFLSRAFPIKNAESKIALWFGTNTDITEQLKVEDALRSNEAIVEAFFDASPGILNVFDEELRYIHTDRVTPTYFGLDRQSLIGKSLNELNPSFAVGFLEPMLKRVLETDVPVMNVDVPGPVPSRGGKIGHWQMSYFPVRLPGGKKGMGVMGIDVTERKQAEEAIRVREHDLRRAQAAAHLGSWRWDLESDTVTWSEELYRIFGVDPGVFVPTNAAANQMFHPDDREIHARSVGQALEGKTVPPFECRIVRPGGEERIVLASGFEVESSPSGKPAVLFETILDITEQARVKMALAESEERLQRLNQELRTRNLELDTERFKWQRLNELLEERVMQRTAALELANRELEEFSYSVSHDLKAPLRLINGFVDLVVKQGEQNLTAKQRQSLLTIQQQTRHMGEIIKSLLDFSKVTRKEPKYVQVDTRKMVEEVVAEQWQLFGEGAKERISVEIGSLPTVEADPILLRMVFANLLSNAFKFTRKVEKPRVTIDATWEDQYIHFRIADNGVGFPKGQTERLFQVFQRLHRTEDFEGTGVGLANVKKIVERHGGQVCGDGEEGKGATFFFTLPIAV